MDTHITRLIAPPDTFPDSPLARAFRQKLMLGLFLPIQAGGWTASRLPRTTTWTFDYNASLTRQAETLGFDLVFGLAQWLPKGGYNEVQNGEALDSFMVVAALAAITSRILLISTVHVLYGPWHPVHFAKFGGDARPHFGRPLGRQRRHRPSRGRARDVRLVAHRS